VNGQAEYARAVALFQAGRPAEAEPVLRALVAARPEYPEALQALGAALAAQGRPAEGLEWFDRALALRPANPGLLHNRAQSLFALGRLEEAIASYREALALQPAFPQAAMRLADALNNRGNELADRGEAQLAIACYEEAIAHAPGNADAHSNLGLSRQEAGDAAGAMASYSRALELRSDHPDALNNLGYLLMERGEREQAMALYGRSLAVNPGSARAAYNLALVHLFGFEFERGWALHEQRFATTPPVALTRPFDIPQLAKEDLGRGHRIAVWAEQGIGDQILYSTLAADLAAAGEHFALQVDPRLKTAFDRAHPDWNVVVPDTAAAAFANCDRHIAIGSLPRLLRPTLASFVRQPRALLAADAQRAREYRSRSSRRGETLIGISWRSFQPKGRAHVARKKSAPLAAFMKLSTSPGVRLLDLQYGDTREERGEFARAGGKLGRLDELDLFNDLDGVLAAIAACDLVVTTSNVTAHLAGALGKRTLLVYLGGHSPFHYWVPGSNGRSPWYPAVEIVTGPDLDTWDKALDRVHELARA
jgi:tetratricopeptide (TPR) repeat protein